MKIAQSRPAEMLLRHLAARAGAPQSEGSSAVDWHRMIREAEGREVEAYLYHQIRQMSPRPAVPPDAMALLQELYCLSALRNQKMYAEVQAVLRALQLEGIRVIVLKGAYLAAHVYPEIALRTMSDIDLLVQPADLLTAHQVLCRLGYDCAADYEIDEVLSSAHHLPPFCMEGATPIEVHWTLERPHRLSRIDLHGVWERSEPVAIAGIPALRLSAIDLIFHLCLHEAHHHSWGVRRSGGDTRNGLPLRPLLDLSVSLTRHAAELDGVRLAGLANRSGIGSFVYCALSLAHEMVGAPLPRDTLSLLDRRPGDDLVVEEVRELLLADGQPRSLRLLEPYQAWAGTAGWTQRRQLLVRMLFPSRESMARIYNLPPHSRRISAYYLIRPLDRLIRRVWEVLRLTASGDGRRVLRDALRRCRISHWTAARSSAARRGT